MPATTPNEVTPAEAMEESRTIPRLQAPPREEIPDREKCRKCNGTGVRRPRKNLYRCKYCKGTGRRTIKPRKPRRTVKYLKSLLQKGNKGNG